MPKNRNPPTFLATTQKSSKKSHRCQRVLLNSTAERIWPAVRNSCVSGFVVPSNLRLGISTFNPSVLEPQRSSRPLPAIRSPFEFYDNPLNAGMGRKNRETLYSVSAEEGETEHPDVIGICELA